MREATYVIACGKPLRVYLVRNTRYVGSKSYEFLIVCGKPLRVYVMSVFLRKVVRADQLLRTQLLNKSL